MKLEVKELTVSYDNVEVLDNIEFSVEEGSFLTIVGDSGTGKSTILKSIAGLIKLSSGLILLNDIDITSCPTEKRNIGYVFQKPLLFPHLNVNRNIEFSLEVSKWEKIKIKNRKDELLKLLHIETLGNRMPHELSGGQQQRVAIARVLAFYPTIILMDEPFSNLDPSLRDQMGELIKEIQEKLNLTVIFVTHDVTEAMKLSDKIVFINNGKVQQIGTSSELFYKPQTEKISRFFGDANIITFEVLDKITESSYGKTKWKSVCYYKESALVNMRPHQLKIIKNQNKFINEEELIRDDFLIINEMKIIRISEIGKDILITLIKNNTEIIVITHDNIDLKIDGIVSVKLKIQDIHVFSGEDYEEK